MQILFTSWILTLLTPITQYHKSYDILYVIIDVFMAQGWKGFIKICLIIIEEIQDKLLENTLDEIYDSFNSLTKENFIWIQHLDKKI